MKKRLFLLLLAALLCLVGMAQADGNLLANGGFEEVDASGSPDGWYSSAYRTQEGYSRFEVTSEKAHSGTYSAKITNGSPNDARYVCALDVDPESLYRFSGYVLVEEMEDSGNGANLAIEDIYSFSECLFDTDGEWQYVEWYGETGENQTEVSIGVRVGGYGAESQGAAYFDDISIEKVDALPSGVIASIWYKVDAPVQAADASEESTPQKNTLWFIVLAAAFLVLALLGRRYLLDDRELTRPTRIATLVGFAVGLIAALVLRVLLGLYCEGYSVDMNCFSAWAVRMANLGPAQFYAEDVFCDYPPGYMLLLWPIGAMINALGYSASPTIRLVVKLIPILCDMALAIFLFAYAKKRLPVKAAAFVGLLFAFNPSAIVNGAAWGQVDCVLTLLMVLTAVFAMEKRWSVAIPLFVVGALTKPQALLFAPVGGIWLIQSLVFATKQERSKQGKSLLWGVEIAIVCAAAIILPFSVRQTDPLWLVKLYQETLSSYNYAVLNTANLMYLLGGNWSTLDEGAKQLSWLIPCVSALLLLAVGVWQTKLYKGLAGIRECFASLKKHWKAHEPCTAAERRCLIALVCVVFGLAFLVQTFLPSTFLVYGATWMVFAYAIALVGMVIDNRADKLPFYMALMLLGVYALGLKIHERYLFVALALLPLAYVRTKDRRMLWLCVGLSVTTFLNTAIVLDNSILFGSSMGHLNSDTIVLNDILCVANVLLYAYGLWIAFTEVKTAVAASEAQLDEDKSVSRNSCYRSELLVPRDARMHIGKRDLLLMGVTMLVYAVVAFTNLGSMKAPQTAWVSTSADEQVVLELDESATFKMLYYAGVSYNNFSISVSEDGESWSEAYPCEMREGLCYRWNYAVTANRPNESENASDEKVTFNSSDVLWLTGKYLRINAESAGLNLWEVIVRNEAGEQLALHFVSDEGAKDVLETAKPAQNLIDEQDTLEGEPGWYTGTYFDEIYHARTAYEHLHGQAPYETTHPPLGKLLMSVGIALFGMTPFGWRFMGTFIGVLMLPALYLLTKQLTKRRDLSTFAMLLFSLDLMHFTQTRIATIDSFPVFFIILSFACMARYMTSDLYAVPEPAPEKPRVLTKSFLKTLIPLALCGFFMGCSIASKWIGLYSAVGLAILFFASVFRQFRAGLVAYDVDLDDGLTDRQKARVLWARELTLKRILVTCAFCVLFFVAVPAVIYYLSYIPYLSPTGPVTLARIIKAQESMLAYHSTPGLGMDHPFQSPWWQWPFILKPMWFAQDKFEPTGLASTIMCMGNPLIFYVGAVCMAALICLFIKKYLRVRGGLALRQGDGNLTYFILVIGFMAQYLPWVLVPRSMYIYHYFASVPFIILATTMLFHYLPQSKPKLRYGLMLGYVLAALIFFVMFFPYASGMLTSTDYLDWLKWFPKLYY